MAVSRTGHLENTRIKLFPGHIVTRYNLTCSFVFVEIPGLIKYYQPVSQNLRLLFYFGPFLVDLNESYHTIQLLFGVSLKNQ
jgi:hypothetical protein